MRPAGWRTRPRHLDSAQVFLEWVSTPRLPMTFAEFTLLVGNLEAADGGGGRKHFLGIDLCRADERAMNSGWLRPSRGWREFFFFV